MAASRIVLDSAGDGWAISSVAAGDQTGALGTLGGFTTPPSAWSFVLAQPVQDLGNGTFSQNTRIYAFGKGTVTLVTDRAASEVRAEELVAMQLPSTWSVGLKDALSTAKTVRPNATVVGYSWTCKRGAASIDDCVWRFTFDGSGGDVVTISVDGKTVIATPAWAS